MNDLSKQQLLLLALLVSFVTSLMTGIVTVSLMDQAPRGVTRTITQVIQRTVSNSVSSEGNSAAVSIAVDDQVADATAEVVSSIVRLRDGATGPVVGLGMIVSASGSIMADKNIIDNLNYPQAVFADGTAAPISVVRFQVDGDIAFLMPTTPLKSPVKPVRFADPVRLGATVWSLTGAATYTLSQGIVNELSPIGTAGLAIVNTTIELDQVMSGAPLFDASGAVIGIETKSSHGSAGASFYPVREARNAVPK
ncbi:MAG: serine protease [Candidatus Paceibacterota bacterium]